MNNHEKYTQKHTNLIRHSLIIDNKVLMKILKVNSLWPN